MGYITQKPMKDTAFMTIRTRIRDYNFTQPVVWSNCNDQNSQEYRNFFFKYRTYPLRWTIPFATVFPADQTALCSYPNHSLSTIQQSILHQRFHPCHCLSGHPWIGTDRNQHPFATERCLPIFSLPSHLSRSYHFAAVSRTFRFSGANSLPEPSQSIPESLIDAASRSFFGDLRSRHQSSDCVWTTAGSQDRIQPQKARAPFLSTPSLLRGQDRRYLGRNLSLRRYPSSSLHHRDPGKKPLQVAFGYSRDSREGRFGLLRSYCRRVHSGHSWFLCHRRSDHQANSTVLREPFLRRNLSWSLDGRVRIQTLAMESTPTFHRSTTSRSRKTLLATFSLQDGWVYLPCNRYQSFLEASKSMALLQSESHRRTHYSRTTRGLYPRQNPNPGLGLQSGLFSLSPFCLQLNQLVQAPLSARRLAATRSSEHSKSLAPGTGSIAPSPRQTDLKSTEQLPVFEDISRYIKENKNTDLSQRYLMLSNYEPNSSFI
jgi:hypothetical protein